MSAIISINDNNILIQQGDKLSSSQGFAWLLEDNVHFDFDDQQAAINVCRLQPQQIHSRYWQQCGQNSIGITNDRIRSSADLIWQHLSAMREQFDLQDVVFAVPSHYQADNLQLLLGIANSSGLSPRGLVNKAVMVAQHSAKKDGKYLHVDLQLHQSVCSSIDVNDGVAKLLDVDVLNDVSINAIQDALLKAMQQSFIQNDRFDPLHYAETEQQLFDQLALTAGALDQDGKAMVVVQQQMHSYNIAIDNSQWNAVIAPFAEKILTHGDSSAHCLLQLNNLFGGTVSAPFTDQRCTIIDDTLRVQSDLTDKANSDGGFAYQTELPILYKGESSKADPKIATDAEAQQSAFTKKDHTAKKDDTANQAGKQQELSPGASHLMQNGIAVRLEKAVLSLEHGQLSLTRSDVSNLDSLLGKQHVFILNDTSRQAIQLNDRIASNHADGVITAIYVEE